MAFPGRRVDPEQSLEKIATDLASLGVPLGWAGVERTYFLRHWWSAVLGLLLIGLAGTMGVPFWFDRLNRFINIRVAGRVPDVLKRSERRGARARSFRCHASIYKKTLLDLEVSSLLLPFRRCRIELGSSNDFQLYEILQQKGFRLGRGDPELEPKGYRTLFLFDLAETFYKRPGLAFKILHNSDHPTLVFPEEQLVARLEAGQVDAGIFYRNEVAEHSLPFITFPPELDLSDPALDRNYSAARYVSPKGTSDHGPAIVYSATIPENSRNREGAIALASFLLSDEGRKITERHALRIIQPVRFGQCL